MYNERMLPRGLDTARRALALGLALGLAVALAGCLRCTGRFGGASDSGVGAPDACAGPSCPGGCCAAGEVCLNGAACCALDALCGSECCGANEVCEGGGCRVDCGALVQCGEPGAIDCCDPTEVCYLGACTLPGDPCDTLNPCPTGWYCEITLARCLPEAPPGMTTCEYRPPAGVFAPAVEWEWTGSPDAPAYDQVMMAPMVADIDLDGMPDIVFNTFAGGNYGTDGVLRAIRGDGSGELWAVTDPALRTVPGAGVAIGNLDADPELEIVTCSGAGGGGAAGPVLVFEHDGTLKWASTSPSAQCGYSMPSIADFFQDGTPDILVRYAVLDASSTVIWANRVTSSLSAGGEITTAADLDGDGYLDVVGGNVAYDRFGGLLWERTDLNDGYPAVADLDLDGAPEVVVVAPSVNTVMALDGATGGTFWGPFDVNQGVPTPSGPSGGGAPTIADFDGDGLPEIAAAGGYGYVVFENDGSSKWFVPTQDLSSRVTGSSVFDFEGDGAAEVVYADELRLWVYAGTDGSVLLETCNTTGTLWEYPLVVDVDADDHAEIVTMSNTYTGWACLDGSIPATGIRVRGDALNNWVRTRRVWNEHTYHVTNVNDDGTVPAVEPPNWLDPALNNFRQNVQPDGLLNAPDLVAADLVHSGFACPAALELSVRVVNQGSSGAPAPIPVAFYEMDPASGALTLLGVVSTTVALLPGQSELVTLVWPIPAGRELDTFQIVAVVNDDGAGVAAASLVHECDETNNAAGPLAANCLLN
jgi:hypothetical protein